MAWKRWAVPGSAGANDRTLATTQTLNVLDNDSFIPALAGLGVLVFAAGLSAIRHGGIPAWLGWVGLVLGIATFTPAGLIAVAGDALWIVVVGIALSLAAGPSREPAAST